MATTSLFGQCTPAIRTDIDRTGAATLMDVRVPLPSELDSLFKTGSNYYLMKAMFMWQLKANAMGIQRHDLFDLLMATAVDVSGKLSAPEIVGTGMNRVAPFIFAKREEPVNNQIWTVSAGSRCDANGDANASGSYWKATIASPDSIPVNVNWFPAGLYIFATTKTEGNVVSETQWKVYSATVDGSTIILVLAPHMSGTSRGTFDWGVTNTVLTPPGANSIVRRGVPNVTPWESYCEQIPGLINNQVDPFWFASTQTSFVVTKGVRELMDRLRAENPLYTEFYDLPEVEYNRQVADDFKRRWTNQIMFGVPGSANQTLASYRSLPTVSFTHPDSSTEVVSYRADIVGFKEQHYQYNRVINCQNANLNIPALAEALYQMYLRRKGAGVPNPEIFECFMPQTFFPLFRKAMYAYYKDQQSADYITASAEDLAKSAGKSFRYVDFPLIHPAGCTIRVVFNQYFDDWKAQCVAAGMPLAGQQMWFVNWKHNRVGIINTERDTRDVGNIKNLAAVNPNYECIMRGREKHIELTNITATAMSTFPAGDLIIEGFANATPEAVNQGNTNYDIPPCD